MSVSAIIVTRGDVDLHPIVASLPDDWQVIVCDNSGKLTHKEVFVGEHRKMRVGDHMFWPNGDLSVYGRYASIPSAEHDLIYVQDDDCIVSDPRKIALCWQANAALQRGSGESDPNDWLFANMPQEFRPHYPDSCLVGFGACFHRDLPARAFGRFMPMDPTGGWVGGGYGQHLDSVMFRRTSDVVFTTLTPRVLVDVPVEVLPYAHDSNRMWKQPDHFGERTRVLEMARKVRDDH